MEKAEEVLCIKLLTHSQPLFPLLPGKESLQNLLLRILSQRVTTLSLSSLSFLPMRSDHIDLRKALVGIFWMLDNGAKWRCLPSEFGSKSAMHRTFQRWRREGVFERMLHEAGPLIK